MLGDLASIGGEMAYATIADVIGGYQPIKTMIGANSYDVTSVEVSSIYIARAESLIDAYLGRKYSVPLAVANPLITQIASDLAVFHMLAERTPSVPEFIDKRYARAISLLEGISSGTLYIGSVTSITSGDNYAWSPTMTYHPVFAPTLNDIDQQEDTDRTQADIDERLTDTSS